MYLYRYELPWSDSSPCLLFKVIGCTISEAFAQDVSQSEIVVLGQQSRFRAPQPQDSRRLFHQFQKPKEKCGSLSPSFSTVSCFYVPTVSPFPSGPLLAELLLTKGIQNAELFAQQLEAGISFDRSSRPRSGQANVQDKQQSPSWVNEQG